MKCGLCLACAPLPRYSGALCNDPECPCHGGDWEPHPDGGWQREGASRP